MAAETRRTRHVPTSLPILGRSEERLEERPQAQNSHLPRVESKYPLPIARRDVPHHLIYPLKETRPNLHIFIGIYVKHVVFYEYVLPVFFSHSFNFDTATSALPALRSHSTRYSTQMAQPKCVSSAGQSSQCYVPGLSRSRDIGALGNRCCPRRSWCEAVRQLVWRWRELPRSVLAARQSGADHVTDFRT